MSKSPEEIIREEWDLLKKSGLLTQISCSAGPKKKTNIFEWKALMAGPKNSPYSGYMFKFEITFPKNYPSESPKVKCITENIYHMNINTNGDVCVSSIGDKWNQAQNISSVLLSIFIIFSKPNPDSPHRRDIADLYKNNKSEYEKKVKENCEKYAIKILQ